MNAHSKLQLTSGETGLVELYKQRAGSLPGTTDVVVARDQAVGALRKTGLPTRKVEAWHYTDLRRLLDTVPGFATESHAEALEPVVDGSTVLHVGGYEVEDDGVVDGLQVTPIADRLRADVGGVSLEAPGATDAVGLINTMLVETGLDLRLDAGAALERPVELRARHHGGQFHSRTVVECGAESAATFIDRHCGPDLPAMASNVTHLTLEKGAEITWIILQEQGSDATHLGQIRATLAEEAKLTLFIVNLGGKLVRQEVHASVQGEGADLAMRAVNLIGGDTHCDVTLELDHAVPNTTSTETVRNVVTGSGQGVFQGQIRVAQIAQKTDAQMACNTLLLSDEAGFSTKPELEIFADDVVCAHGATVAEIDENHLFYLMARGIAEKTARGLLVKAFVAEIIEELDDEALIEALEVRLDNWLEAHL